MTQPFRSSKDAQVAREASAHARRMAMEAEQQGDMDAKQRHLARAISWELKAEEYDNYGQYFEEVEDADDKPDNH